MKEIMNSREVEKYLDVSDATLRRWRSDGLEYVKIGGSIFYLADSIKDFMKNNLVNDYRR